MVLLFEDAYFHHQFNERSYIFGAKGDFVVPWVFLSRYSMLISHFQIFHEVSKLQSFKLLLLPMCITTSATVSS